jgi:peptide-methionine (R)-S-oxide reductase
MDFELHSEDWWRAHLTAEEYRVMRQAGTEAPFLGKYTDTETVGVYSCKGCGSELFSSRAKFHSGCGWPSFFAPSEATSVREIVDTSHGMTRTEIRCAQCDSHLGHVFSGEGYGTPTDLRYCINSICLTLKPDSSDSNS